MATLHWFLRGEWKDSIERPRSFPDHRELKINTIYVCPQCGDVWSKLMWEEEETLSVRYHPIVSRCLKCGGGLLLDHVRVLGAEYIVENYPPKLIEHEANVMRPKVAI